MTATDLPVCVRIIIKGCFLEKKKKKNLFLSSSIYCEVNHLSSYRECIVVLCCCCYKCLLLSLRWLLSSASCPLPSHPPPPRKEPKGLGFDWGAEGASPAESDLCLQSSRSETGGLHMSNLFNERVEEHSCEELQRLRKAKFSSPKPPRASGKPSGFMKSQRALVRAGAAAWSRPRLPRERVVSCKARVGCSVLLAFLVVLVGCSPCLQSWVKTILRSNKCFRVQLWLEDPRQGGRGGAPLPLDVVKCGGGTRCLRIRCEGEVGLASRAEEEGAPLQAEATQPSPSAAPRGPPKPPPHFPCHDFFLSLKSLGGPDLVLISLKASPPMKSPPLSLLPPHQRVFISLELVYAFLSLEPFSASFLEKTGISCPTETPRKMLCILET